MDATDSAGLLHHVELYASDFEAAVEFWEWFLAGLGYERYQTWDEGRSWKRGPTYLVVVDAPDSHRDESFHRAAPGLNHLAFHARNRAHVDELTDALRERGRTILYEERHPFAGGDDYYAVYFEGPERLKLEVVAPPVADE